MTEDVSSWFAGPKAENADWFEPMLARIVQDYYAWRRNYFPEDGAILDSRAKRAGEPFRDEFEDRLVELLGRLKADFPFQSPRYAAHMVAEQSLPGIAGYFAAMLYNPNNVSREAAPVTVRLELEACAMISRMLGYGDDSWGHLCSGGTIANVEALWIARTVAYLPSVVAEMRGALGLNPRPLPHGMPALQALREFGAVFEEAGAKGVPLQDAINAYRSAEFCVVERGMAAVVGKDGRQPVVLVPESHHYCFEKAMDLLGMGRSALVSVAVDSTFRMDVQDLARQLDVPGRLPIAVTAVVGTTEEGAVDPVDQILDLRSAREREGKPSFWLHIDGAYGAYLRTMTHPSRLGLGEPWCETFVAGETRRLALQLPERYACDALERLGEADSITIDPHKLGYVPYPAGAVCFRSDLVKPLVRQEAPYIEEAAESVESERRSPNVGMYILEGSKPGAAAAAVWLSHALIPLDTSGHGKLIQETVRNACELHALLEGYPEWVPGTSVRAVTMTPPGSNILCFAFRPHTGADLEGLNALNRRVHDRLSGSEESGRRVYDQPFFVSRTTLSAKQYRHSTVAPFLERLGVSQAEYEAQGVFLLRSVLMNPWYSQAKTKGRHYLAELTEELYASASASI